LISIYRSGVECHYCSVAQFFVSLVSTYGHLLISSHLEIGRMALFVAQLPTWSPQSEVEAHFSQYGELKKCVV
jgi:hypothetical protein